MQATTLRERIVTLRDLLKKTQVRMAEELNITQSSLSQMESGTRGVSLGVILKLIDKYRVNANWLLNGQGTPFEAKKAMASPSRSSTRGEALIPLIDRKARADYPRKLNDEDFIKSFSLYRIPGFEEGNYRMFEIEGDSMEPAIFQGEIVISEYIEDPETAVNGKIFVIVSKDSIVVKRLLLYLNDANAFILKSDNPLYKSYQLKRDEILEIWEVKSKITSQFLTANDESGARMAELERRISRMEEAIRKLVNRESDAGNGGKRKKSS